MLNLFPVGFPKRNRLIDNEVGTSPIVGASKDCVITSIRVVNTTGTDQTFDLEDNASTPNQWYEAVNMPANKVTLEERDFAHGIFCEGGFDYNANGAGLDAQIVYWTRG